VNLRIFNHFHEILLVNYIVFIMDDVFKNQPENEYVWTSAKYAP